MPVKVLADLRRRLDPLARKTSPLNVPPPRNTRFGSPLVLSRVHWVEPKLVAEITYLTWTADSLCGIRFMSGCGRTSRRSRCGASEQNRRAHLANADASGGRVKSRFQSLSIRILMLGMT